MLNVTQFLVAPFNLRSGREEKIRAQREFQARSTEFFKRKKKQSAAKKLGLVEKSLLRTGGSHNGWIYFQMVPNAPCSQEPLCRHSVLTELCFFIIHPFRHNHFFYLPF